MVASYTSMNKALCIDVGGTRIKATVLPERLTHDALRQQQMFVMETLGWLNQSLPELLSTKNPYSLVNQPRILEDFAEIAICVPGPVENGRLSRMDLGVPANLTQELSNFTDKRITLVKDADAWIVGATAYLELANQGIVYPVAGLTLGTGVGLAAANDANHFLSLEISNLRNQFRGVEQASGHPIEDAWQIHNIVGSRFFEWVRSDKRHWTRQRIEDDYSKRVVAVLDDILCADSLRMNSVKTVLLGGGNSVFVSAGTLEKGIDCEVKSLSPPHIDIDPNLLSLIGLCKLAFSGSVRIEV